MYRIRIAVTGGPGAGKTTLLTGLESRGYQIVPEVARMIICERKSKGMSARPAPKMFARQILERDIEQYLSVTEDRSDPIFFDRGIVDALGMLYQSGHLSLGQTKEYVARYPYYRVALILPPWSEIYITDAERDQSYDESVRVYEWLRLWYIDCGYDLLEVPQGTVDERCEYVLRKLSIISHLPN